MIDRVLKQRSHRFAAVGVLVAVAVSGGSAYATSTTAVRSSSNHTASLAGAAGDVLVGEGGGGVLRIHPNGTSSGQQTVVKTSKPLKSPGGLCFGPKGKVLYVTDRNEIVRINTSTGHAVVVRKGSPFGSLSDVKFGPDGMLYASDSRKRVVWKVNPKTGHTSALARGGQITSPTIALAIGPTGAIYVETSGRVVKVNPKTGHQTLVSDDPQAIWGQAGLLYGIAVSSKGKIYLLIGPVRDSFDPPYAVLLQVDPSKPASSNATVISVTGYGQVPSGLAFTQKGKLLAADPSNDTILLVEQFDPRTGGVSVAFSGGMLARPDSITAQP